MFSSSQIDAGVGFTASQSTDSAPLAKSRGTQGLIPLTVKQIGEASQSGDEKANLSLNGLDVTNVTLVGMISEKTERKTDVGFSLDDGTGKIGCKRWVNDAFDTKQMEEIQDGMYIRVNGHLKIVEGGKRIVAFSVRPVTNFDEVTFHFIECIHNQLENSKSQRNASSQSQSADTSTKASIQNGSDGYQTSISDQFTGQHSADGLKSCDQLVLDYLQQPSSVDKERGIHRDELSQQLKVPMGKILESIRCLEEEGLIYSTIDEFHYKSAA